MSALNKRKKTKNKKVSNGCGKKAQVQSSFQELKRLVATYLLFEDRYYNEEKEPIERIIELTKDIDSDQLVQLIEEVRLEYGLRHTPIITLLGAIQDNTKRRDVLNKLNPNVLATPKDVMDLVSAYLKLNNGKMIPNQLKKYISKSLNNFDAYQLSKYGRNLKQEVSLVDIFNLVHPVPKNNEKALLWKSLIDGELAPAETWEVKISAAPKNKRKEIWENLLKNKKLGMLAFIRNIRNMEKDNVDEKIMVNYIKKFNGSTWIFPYQIFKASIHTKSKKIKNELLKWLKRSIPNKQIKGKTYIVLDISGSMGNFDITSNPDNNAMRALSVLIAFILAIPKKDIEIFFSSGDDSENKHATKKVTKHLYKQIEKKDAFKKISNFIKEEIKELGWGGIFTYQSIDWILKNYKKPERIIVISDSQDMDRKNRGIENLAKAFPGIKGYVNNIAPYSNVGYTENSGWNEINTFSTKIIDFIDFVEAKSEVN